MSELIHWTVDFDGDRYTTACGKITYRNALEGWTCIECLEKRPNHPLAVSRLAELTAEKTPSQRGVVHVSARGSQPIHGGATTGGTVTVAPPTAHDVTELRRSATDATALLADFKRWAESVPSNALTTPMRHELMGLMRRFMDVCAPVTRHDRGGR